MEEETVGIFLKHKFGKFKNQNENPYNGRTEPPGADFGAKEQRG